IKYATLSHYWGELQFLTLVTDNLETFHSQITPEVLHATFRDTIDIFRPLKIGYLWVDSRCILQHCEDDWRHVSPLMTELYGNAHVNIATTSAEDERFGCFVDRDARWRGQAMSSDRHSLLNVSRTAKPLPHGLNQFKKCLFKGVYLHFTSVKVYWECDEKLASEVWLGVYPSLVGRRKEIVEQYSQASLSYDKDRLIAISGLAQHIGDIKKGQFIAGPSWKTCCGTRNYSWNSRITPPTVPTWPWASLSAAVTYRVLKDHDIYDNPDARLDRKYYVKFHGIMTEGIFKERMVNISVRLRCQFLFACHGYFGTSIRHLHHRRT
ncbi:hypothetical protein QBC36DRAFT_200826, partial [Triangularia setosa]